MPNQAAPRAAVGVLARVGVWLFGCLVVCAWVGCSGGETAREGGSRCPGACEPGNYRCNEQYLLTCDASCAWSLAETCETVASCDASVGRCASCEAGDTRCSGDVWEGCAEDGSAWVEIEVCTSRCLPSGCDPCVTPGEVRCSDPDPSAADLGAVLLQQCTGGVGWEDRDTCDSEDVCLETSNDAASDPESFSGACRAPICTPGERRCDPETPEYVQACSDTGTSWRVLVVCSAGQTCAMDSNGAPVCGA